jgi:hypothetical protein
MNNNKSPGIDNTLIELYKKGRIRIKEEVPTDWKTNIIAPIYKIRATNDSVQL